ncbi:MAG TPA: hypothetical protein VF453_13690, partial [Burkholderiaceae bacterium]
GNLAQAERSFRPSRNNAFAEGADDAVRLALRGRPDPFRGEAARDFAAIAEAVYGPLRAHLEEAA